MSMKLANMEHYQAAAEELARVVDRLTGHVILYCVEPGHREMDSADFHEVATALYEYAMEHYHSKQAEVCVRDAWAYAYDELHESAAEERWVDEEIDRRHDEEFLRAAGI